MEVLQNTDVPTHTDYTTLSRNYKLGMAHKSMQANTKGNIIFDVSSQLPREVMLETTMEVFGYTVDMWEVRTATLQRMGYVIKCLQVMNVFYIT